MIRASLFFEGQRLNIARMCRIRMTEETVPLGVLRERKFIVHIRQPLQEGDLVPRNIFYCILKCMRG